MHILLTDILTCPRCGPQHGLILLADRMQERRVLAGALGCANCREKYPIRDGTVVFTGADAPAAAPPPGAHDHAPGGSAAAQVPGAAADDPEAAVRIAALSGVTQGPGYVLLAGPAAGLAHGVAALLEGVEVIVVAAPGTVPWVRSGPGTDRLEAAAPLPLASARMAAVVLSGAAADELLEEGCRVLSPLGRLVLEGATGDAATRLEACGLRVLAHEADTIVAVNRHAAPRPAAG